MKWLVTDTGRRNGVQAYLDWLAAEGIEGERITPALMRASALGCYDALLLTGGGDVEPGRYNEARAPQTHGVDPERDDLEIRLIRAFLAEGKPILGICRGQQILNVALGGKLIQDLPSYGRAREHPLDEQHAARRGDAVHPLLWKPDAAGEQALRGATRVNSSHHQAVHPHFVGAGLRVAAVSPGGVVEALEGDGLPSMVFAVQWHPERLRPADQLASRGLLRWFLARAGLAPCPFATGRS